MDFRRVQTILASLGFRVYGLRQIAWKISAMLRIWRPSGQELATFNAEQFEHAAALKEHVCEHYGFPVYLQQLLHDGSLLADDAKLDGLMDLQLVLMSISGPQLLAEEHLSKASRTNHVKIARSLLEAGVERDCRDSNGCTALMRACESGHLEVTRVLLEAGAGRDCRDSHGRTALMRTSKNGDSEIARLLLEAGAGTDIWDHYSKTALMLACGSGHLEVTRLLLEAGADKNVCDRDGRTALMWASDNGHSEVARLLESAAAETAGTAEV